MLLEKRIPLSYIYNKIKTDLLIIILIGVCAHFLSSAFVDNIPEMPSNIPAFLGTAITVLLSFKISQSYDRWWEARKVWGAIVNDSRSFVIQLQTYIPNAFSPIITTLAYRQIAWCYSLGQSLRGLDPLEGTQHLLTENDLNQITPHKNKPLALVQLNALDIKQLQASNEIDTFRQVQLDSTLVRLVDSMGKAERINSTVFPKTYRLFLHLAIYLFVITLSISLREIALIYELPLLVILSSIFLLLEKTAYHLQDPFRNRPSDTSVTAIARTIEINIRQLLGEKDIPDPIQPHGFYLL
ncbi:bestrophin family protein [Rufibacter roseolus]|uniref:bestrophin family protein n=1 Tax=Rufibacter roseolus TaxID=2817375 RepID=UPI001B311C80|nr:bestrophin family ion channel [Rufibacter roseolus]